MCDQDAMDDMLRFGSSATLSRRRFGQLSVGAGLVSLLPRAADALAVTGRDVQIDTPQGKADAYFVHPATGKYPGVLVWPDVFGLRPAFRQMANRLAESGYAVLVPNPFYRTDKAPVFATGVSFDDPAVRTKAMSLMGALSPTTQVMDATAMVTWLDHQPVVDTKRKLATTGYCMGGPYTLRTAATFPNRIGAAASFHGGGLVTDKPDSPHLLVAQIKARYLIAIAANDDERQPDAKDVLRDAFAAVKLPAEIEVYAGAMHGWCPPDSAVYNEAQAERAWSRLLALLQASL